MLFQKHMKYYLGYLDWFNYVYYIKLEGLLQFLFSLNINIQRKTQIQVNLKKGIAPNPWVIFLQAYPIANTVRHI